MVHALALALVLHGAPEDGDVDPSSAQVSADEPAGDDAAPASGDAEATIDDAAADAGTAPSEAAPLPASADVGGDLPTSEAPAPSPAPSPATRQPVASPRAGRGLTIAGAVLSGIGLAGRVGIDVFLATAAGLHPRDPYGRWSVGPFFMATAFFNAPTLAGVGLLAGGAHRKGRAEGALGLAPDRRRRRLGIGLLGGGLGLWGLTRALFLPWTRGCESNACAYAYLESSYFISAGAVIAGSMLVARETGRRRGLDDHQIAVTPLIGPGAQGLALSGRF